MRHLTGAILLLGMAACTPPQPPISPYLMSFSGASHRSEASSREDIDSGVARSNYWSCVVEISEETYQSINMLIASGVVRYEGKQPKLWEDDVIVALGQAGGDKVIVGYRRGKTSSNQEFTLGEHIMRQLRILIRNQFTFENCDQYFSASVHGGTPDAVPDCPKGINGSGYFTRDSEEYYCVKR